MKLKHRMISLVLGTILTVSLLFVLVINELTPKDQIGEESSKQTFQIRNLQKIDNSHSLSDNPTSNEFIKESSKDVDTSLDLKIQKDSFEDISQILKYLNVKTPKYDSKKSNITIGNLAEIELKSNSSVWDKFQMGISQFELYGTDTESQYVIEEILYSLANSPFDSITEMEGGTQFKLLVDLEDGGEALLKPMRFPRNQGTLPNHFHWNDFERHNAEIAAYHLDKLLGFRRAVPVSGRKINITTDLKELAESEFLHTFYISPVGNVCFHGKCSYYCDTSHGICGNPDDLEASLAAFLPPKSIAPRKKWRSPWRQSYNKHKKAKWEISQHNYCDEMVKKVIPYHKGRRLLDIMDMAIFDFLMGNLDRHHYETFKQFDHTGHIIHLDHGRGFGKAHQDEVTKILAPMTQCCMIRKSTLETLLNFHNSDETLGKSLKKSLKSDPVNPVLLEPHFEALDRRVELILKTVRDCIIKKAGNTTEVIFSHDEHYNSGNIGIENDNAFLNDNGH